MSKDTVPGFIADDLAAGFTAQAAEIAHLRAVIKEQDDENERIAVERDHFRVSAANLTEACKVLGAECSIHRKGWFTDSPHVMARQTAMVATEANPLARSFVKEKPDA